MKIIFDGAHVQYEGAKGQPHGKYRAPLPRKRVHWTGQIQLRDGAGNAVETTWSTPKNQRMDYVEVRTAVFAIVEELQRQFIEEYQLGPDSVHFTLVSR
ncbi:MULTISPECIES: hypothetical protein [Pseudomonas]|uniref:hypothetical protein n=1 Tax=Pseudomonas TaxID=286 RepID=UPI0007620177|nr:MULTISPECIES: hypothetical protein [Pseudomonas]MDG9809510.1 hypothetical protein [Pseudomonas juntendi]MDG9815756.1 hypothetical protein [Pseudomonas putida]